MFKFYFNYFGKNVIASSISNINDYINIILSYKTIIQKSMIFK